MILLDQLRSPAVALEWHEAVAVAAALAGLVTDSGSTTCPDPATVVLLPSGELHTSGSAQMPGGAARGLVTVLAQLLDRTPCPAELRQTVQQFADGAEYAEDDRAAVARLMSQLMFFERPDRPAVLAALASRANAALERDRHDTAVSVLTDRMRAAAAMAPQPADRPWPPTLPGPLAPVHREGGVPNAPLVHEAEPMAPPQRPPLVAVVVALTVFLGMAYAVASWFDSPPTSASIGDGQPDEETPAAGEVQAVPPAPASSASRRPPTPSRAPATAASGAAPPGADPRRCVGTAARRRPDHRPRRGGGRRGCRPCAPVVRRARRPRPSHAERPGLHRRRSCSPAGDPDSASDVRPAPAGRARTNRSARSSSSSPRPGRSSTCVSSRRPIAIRSGCSSPPPRRGSSSRRRETAGRSASRPGFA